MECGSSENGRRRRWWSRVLGAAVAVGTIAIALGARPSQAQVLEGGWQVELGVSAGLFRIEGDRTVDPREGVVPFASGLGQSRLTWSGRIEVGKGGWRWALDGRQVSADEKRVAPDAEAALPFRLTAGEVWVSRRLGKGGPGGWVEASAGLRYSHLSQQLLSEDEPSTRRQAEWIDPLIGFRYQFTPYRRMGFLTTVEIGGLGFGSAFSWGVRMGCLVRLTSTFASLIEYRVLDIDYQRGRVGELGSFVYNGTSHGLVTTLLIRL